MNHPGRDRAAAQVLRDFRAPEGMSPEDLDANGDGQVLAVLDLRTDDALQVRSTARLSLFEGLPLLVSPLPAAPCLIASLTAPPPMALAPRAMRDGVLRSRQQQNLHRKLRTCAAEQQECSRLYEFMLRNLLLRYCY
jgi:hypothetical protein